MKEKLIKRLYNYWACTGDDLNNGLWENISDIINNKGKNGAEDLLDWCRDDYDRAKENYMELHNLDEDEMEKIMEDNCGNFKFMYNEIGFLEELDEIWNICNWYLDYCNDEMGEDTFYSLSKLGSVE